MVPIFNEELKKKTYPYSQLAFRAEVIYLTKYLLIDSKCFSVSQNFLQVSGGIVNHITSFQDWIFMGMLCNLMVM